ncbi:ABC transporter ATP-binding protein [Halalkalicoccus jeotgali]|uniref:ABC transporter related protein n=1 Tax=Halalkalicoccus jeotgali (strain DSM 18796 / CECT 7217 / JCM 14584 / KCTC 4019 / B3) TaxID=795797 RepID=D8J5J3_HALJB|nr:ABC transporter ATP-binding protein [Halalkalicoccus jeotgali]ADJ15689.1 ABC transporter related protein [Halalkalicoccus jeotgali B3]ELY36541.1 ABC transporter-like protein [Halalkalicoccus jeotgali B3]
MDNALVAEDLSRSYGDTAALDGVSLAVERGEVFALIGPNGAGKTTLVRALTGTTTPDAGEVSVFGAPLGALDENRISLLPQAFSPPERLTGRELLAYYAGLYDESRPVEDVLSEVGMADEADAWYETLSGGQQRRICVGSALVNDPDLLFLDEPTTGIDPAGRRDLWALIGDLADGGTTVLLTTHNMAEAEALADRVGLLADGRLVEVGSPDSLVATHGGESRLVVETDAGPDALAGSGYRVSATRGELTIHGIDPEGIATAVRALERAGVEYESLAWTQPTLEDVYLELADERAPEEPATVGGAQ